MRDMKCWECGRAAGAPASAERPVDQTVLEFAICLDCLDRLRQDGSRATAAGEAVRAGSVCALCLTTLEPTAGYVVWAFDDAHPLKLCATCKEKAEWGHRDEPP